MSPFHTYISLNPYLGGRKLEGNVCTNWALVSAT